MKKYKSDLGRSMMEVLLYLSLIIFMTVTSVKMYADYNEKIKRTKAQDQLETISGKVSQIYFGRTFGTEKISLNDKIKQNNVSLIDPWGKDYDVKTDNDTMYHITVTKTNKANCIYLAMNVESKVKEPVVNNTSNTTATPFTLCKDGENTVSFYYTIR